WGNSAVHTVAFNRRLQPSQVKLTVSGAVQQQYDYSYGQFNTGTGAVDTSKNNGQIGKINATIGTTAQWNQGFSYDELGRLTNAVEYQGSSMSTQTYALAYGYDRYGNRTQSANATLGLPAISSSDYDTSNNNNRFVSSVATYDAAGNITTDAKFRSLTYAYDANGRQKSATNGTWTQTQVYDCAGQRVQTTVGSTTRTTVYDAFGQTVAEYSGAALERENIYRGAALLATYEAGTSTLRYVLTDAQGSTRAVVNSSGAVTARHDYLPFGEEIGTGFGLRTSGQGFGATDTNRQKYGLTERDDTSGLDHTWWRKYENKSGRWTSPDPLRGTIVAPQTFNAYTYAANDPVNFIDPAGLDPQGTSGGGLGPWAAIGIATALGGPDSSTVLILGWGQVLGGGDGSEWVTVAVIDRTSLNFGSPQNPPRDSTLTPSEIDQLLKDLEARLKDQECAKFVQDVLMHIKGVTGTAAYSTNILDIFKEVKKQGGFGRHAGPFIAEAANGVGGGKAFVNINYSIAANSSGIYSSASSGRTIIHELLHVASNSGMTISHFQMASAAYAANGRKGPAPTTDRTKEADRRNSDYFDDKLFDACHVR
ncbi:MAG TPA: RHS repeat-associated core domain-containing protein, partial [Pyrinomonadaceae bacterium]|nr:RHS repeat-associated core domain-containing protein [Pyrinomonadaceae bacterium]